MVTVCWSPKGGTGTSVVAAALALASADDGADTLLVDLGGDQPALLGLAETPAAGLTDWLEAADEVPLDALTALEQPVTQGLQLLPRGRGGRLRPGRLELAGEVFATAGRTVVVDGGAAADSSPLPGADRQLVVVRACYLAVRRLRAVLAGAGLSRTVVVLVEEGGRALRAADVAAALHDPAMVTTSWDPAVARAVDAGLLVARLPRSLRRLAAAVDRVGRADDGVVV